MTRTHTCPCTQACTGKHILYLLHCTIHSHEYTHTHTHTHTHTRTHTHAHTHTHTHTHTKKKDKRQSVSLPLSGHAIWHSQNARALSGPLSQCNATSWSRARTRRWTDRTSSTHTHTHTHAHTHTHTHTLIKPCDARKQCDKSPTQCCFRLFSLHQHSIP